jgi:hypothetical protein
MKEDTKILPFNGYAVDAYNFDGDVELFVEKVFAVEIWSNDKNEATTGSVIRSVFSSTAQDNHMAVYFIDENFNVLNDEDNLILIENESLLCALRNLCEYLANKYRQLLEAPKSIGFNLGAYDRNVRIYLTDEVVK